MHCNTHSKNAEEFIKYYTGLVLNIGHDTKVKFKNAVCLVVNESIVYEHDGDDIGDHFVITSKPHNIRKPGFPMDSISLDIETGKYFMDMTEEGKNEKKITEGFRKFLLEQF